MAKLFFPLPDHTPAEFVSDVADKIEDREVTTWKTATKPEFLKRLLPIRYPNKTRHTGFVKLTVAAKPKGHLQATTILSKELDAQLANDPDPIHSRRRAHAMIASEFVQLLLTHYPRLKPVLVL